MVEGLTRFRFGISLEFLRGALLKGVSFFVVTYPPDPLPLGIDEGKGEIIFERCAAPLLTNDKYYDNDILRG
jgi:hypothetical protein